MAAPAQASSIGPWGKATAGATGAVLANAVVYPLDIVKTKLQVQEDRKPAISSTTSSTSSSEPSSSSSSSSSSSPHYQSTFDAISQILSSEGLPGLYAGISGSLLGVASTNFAYFYWYSTVRTVYLRRATRRTFPTISTSSIPSHAAALPISTATELAIGAVAGALAQLCTIPVAVITTRQQTQGVKRGEKRKGFVETAREVVEGEDGWSGLWRGLKASLVLVVNPSITYGAYERLKVVLFPGRTRLKAWEAFLLGALSKSLATLVTQPLIVAKVGLQSRPPPSRNGMPFKNFVEVMRFIIKNEGVMRLFKGLGPQLLKGLLVQGILMMIKERMELLFTLLLFRFRQIRSRQLVNVAALAATKAGTAVPLAAK